MSTGILYDLKVVRINGASIGKSQDHYLQFVLNGSSNTYTYSGARARSWGAMFFGTAEDIMAHAIDLSSSFEGGGLVYKSMGASGRLQPQQWIAKIRRLLATAELVPDEFLSDSGACFDALRIVPKGDCEGFSLQDTLKAMCGYMEKSPGDTFWHFLRVTGPGQN